MEHVYITGLKSNQTVSRPATLAGHVDNDGTCHGSTPMEHTWKYISPSTSGIYSENDIFGNISAEIIGIYIRARVVKLIIDTFLHGYALHIVYG
ncbi:hypothetical protein ALC56_09146 [Trachymyrmex septentrionalis]|uniref:Uncharacterized protein n=1 Tax=Trachymyrmex septentrionalis TaxID=34720 RepID=A0A151JUT5_9HYME|nr:hypothetical protein ALC56_09146 [Trachymyrmex septentrionalis]